MFKLLAWAFGGLIVVTFTIFALKGAHDPFVQGIESCKQVIRAASKNPSTVEFSFGNPHSEDAYKDGESWGLRLIWDRDQLQMQNGFGAMLGTRAECVIDRKTGEVLDLQIN
jgi:hypothetical protein